jgi:hypothetical protein
VQLFVQLAHPHPPPHRRALQLATPHVRHLLSRSLPCSQRFSSCSSSFSTWILNLSSLLATVPSDPLRMSSGTTRGLECNSESYKLTYHSGSPGLWLFARTWLGRCDQALQSHGNSSDRTIGRGQRGQGNFRECLDSCPDGTRERLFRPTRAHVALRHQPHSSHDQ